MSIRSVWHKCLKSCCRVVYNTQNYSGIKVQNTTYSKFCSTSQRLKVRNSAATTAAVNSCPGMLTVFQVRDKRFYHDQWVIFLVTFCGMSSFFPILCHSYRVICHVQKEVWTDWVFYESFQAAEMSGLGCIFPRLLTVTERGEFLSNKAMLT